MEKLKQIFSPGHEADDEILYGSGATGQSGQGSHLGAAKSSSPTDTTSSPAADTSTVEPTADAPTKASGTAAATSSEEPAAGMMGAETSQGTSAEQGSAGGYQATGSADPTPSHQTEDLGVGHDNDLGVAPGSAEIAATTAIDHSESEKAAEPSSSEPSTTPFHKTATSPTSPMANIAAAKAWSSVGAEKGSLGQKVHEGMPGTYPLEDYENPYLARNLDPRVDKVPRAPSTSTTIPTPEGPPPSHHTKESVPTTAYPSGELSPPSNQPTPANQEDAETEKTSDEHTGRNAAAAAVGTGAVGVGAYELEKHHGTSEPETTSTVPAPTTPAPTSVPYDSQQAEPPTGMAANAPVDTSNVEDKTQDDSHKGRDAALVGAAGVGTAAVGAHEYSKHEAEKAEKRQKEAEKQAAKEQKAAEKEAVKEQKAHEKAIAKEEKQHEKELAMEEKKAEREHEKEMIAQQKEEQKARKEAEKAEGKEEEGEKKKHRSLFGFLKRRKNKDTGEDEDYEDEEEGDHHTGAEAAAGVGAVGAGAYAAEKHHEHNKLHKDPPKGYYDNQPEPVPAGQTPGKAPYDDYAIKENDHPGAQTITGGYTAPDPAYGGSRYADPPTKGYAAQVTGGTGTTALAQGQDGPKGSHATGMGNVLDSKIGPEETTASGSIVGTNATAGSSEPFASEGVAYGAAPTEGYASQVTGGTGTTALAQEGGAPEVPEGYAPAPAKGYAAQVTGGTGTTALAQGESGPRGSHATGMGNVVDSMIGPDDTTASGSLTGTTERTTGTAYAPPPTKGYAAQVTGGTGTTALAQGGRVVPAPEMVIEPITGLPMDLSKGTGEGGTDGAPIPGFRDRDFSHGSTSNDQ